MWIERLEFIGFGNLTGQRIDFGKNKLSIVVQPNEYGKSTIAESIWATLFGYPVWDSSITSARPGIERKPLSGAAFKSVLDLSTSDRHMRLIRNFSERSLKVLDLSKDLGKANSDITSEFAKAIAADEFGLQLTGLTRSLFQSCCLIGQRQLDHAPFAGDRSLSSLLLSMADSGGHSASVFEAIGRIEDTLEHFPFRGKTQVAVDLIENLRNTRDSLAEKLAHLEDDRQGCSRDIDRLSEVDGRLQEKIQRLSADEYFHLCLETADIDSHLSRAQEKSVRVSEVQNLIKAYEKFEHFPIERQKDVEELWIGRQSRLNDLRRLETEIQSKSVETQIHDLEHRERADGLEHFTVDDAQALSSLARTLKDITADLQETRRLREDESMRVQKLGIDFNQLSDIRYSLLCLEPKELDDAHAYHAMIVGSRERSDECERLVERARFILKDVLDQRETFVATTRMIFWPSLGVAALLLAGFIYLTNSQHLGLSDSRVAIVLILYVLSCVGAGICFFGAQRIKAVYRIHDERIARSDEQKQNSAVQELQAKIVDLEMRMESLARKASLTDGTKLVRHMQEYTKWAVQLKELDVLDQMILSKEAHVAKIKQQTVDYYLKGQRPVEEINSKDVFQFADSINQFHAARRRNESSTEVLDHRQSEVKFLTDEVKHGEERLCDHFQRAGLTFSDVQDGYYSWTDAIVGYRRWELNKNELIRFEGDPTTDLIPSELSRIIERLEIKRSDLWARIKELLLSHPSIAEMPPPMGEAMASAHSKDMADLRLAVEELRRERDELTVQLRAAMKNYQDNYLQTLEDLEAIERELNFVSNQRTSLLLARDTYLRLSDENHSVWGDKLTDITREMLKHLGTEYESIEFDADLSLSVRRKGQKEALNEWQMNAQLSTGMREQLHWLARMAVLRFLSDNKALPIILDEPFSEFDDERFLKIMRFLINSIARHNQVIIFTCHQQRHEWLMDQLDPPERDNVELCRLIPLNTLSVR